MDVNNPGDAQSIVVDYLKVVEAHAARDLYPSSVRDLPHTKDTIRAAFKTSVLALVVGDKLTPALREYLEIAYVSLADYVDEEGALLLREYSAAAAELAADQRLAREKITTAPWLRLSDQSRLAGELAATISAEARLLLAEFRSWQPSASS